MVEEWSYIGTIVIPDVLPDGVQTEWAATLKAEQARIKASLDGKIPDAAKFKDRLADLSSERYAAWLNPEEDPTKYIEELRKQRVKLGRAYPSWAAGVLAAFGEGGYFPDLVDAKAGKLDLARYVYAAVGHKASVPPTKEYYSWGAVTMGVLAMRGDTRVLKYVDDNDDFQSLPIEAVFDASLGRLVSPPIIAKAVYGSVMARYMLEADEEAGITAFLGDVNTEIDKFVALALNPAHLGGDNDATFELSWDADNDVVIVTVIDTHTP